MQTTAVAGGAVAFLKKVASGNSRPLGRLLVFVVVVVVGLLMAKALNVGPFVIAGLADGSVYALAALGLVITYKTSGIFNFAQGAVGAAAAYTFYTFYTLDRLPWPVAALITIVIVGCFGGLVLERMAYWLRDAHLVFRVAATVGILVLLESALTGLYGGATLQIAPFLPTETFRFVGVYVQYSQVIDFCLCIAAVVGLSLMFKRTRVGLAMQAIVAAPELLSLAGTSPTVVRRYAWSIGTVFASISGILIAPVLGIQIDYMLLLYIAAYGAAAMGAFNSISWTFCGALVIGIVSDILSDKLQSFHSQAIQHIWDQVPFIVLFAVLLLMPRRRLASGLTGQVRRLRAVRPVPTRFSVPALAGGAVLACFIPAFAGVNLNAYSSGLAFAVIFGSLFLLTWTSGQLSLCQIGFAAVGAAALYRGEVIGLPWAISLLFAGMVTAAVGIVLALPTMRLVGIYLAVGTFGFGLLLQEVLYNTFLMFGGAGLGVKIRRPDLFGAGGSDRSYYYLCLVVVAACFVGLSMVRRSRLGRLLKAMGDSPAALDAHGVDTRAVRLCAFAVSAFFAGIGGALIAGVTEIASAATYQDLTSLVLMAVIVFCGRRPTLSPIVAAFVYAVMEVYKPFSTGWFLKYSGVCFGVLAIAVGVYPNARSSWQRLMTVQYGAGSAQRRRRLIEPVAAMTAVPSMNGFAAATAGNGSADSVQYAALRRFRTRDRDAGRLDARLRQEVR